MVLLGTCVQAQDPLDASYANLPSLKKMSIEELLNVEVGSVSRVSQKLAEAASAIQVITQEQIRRSGATSLPEILRLATNLQVAQVNSSQWAISARGFNNVLANKLLVMIDGRTVYTPLYAGVFWDVQNILIEDIDRIEVISGPGGTLWGSNAVNGVINIVSKSSKETHGAVVEGAFGNELQAYGGVRYGGKIKDALHYRAYATGFRKDGAEQLEGGDAGDEWTMAQGGLQFDWDVTDNDAIVLQGNLYDTRPNPDSEPVHIKAQGQNTLLRWNHTFSENADFQVQIYFDRTWRDFRNEFTERLNTYDIDAQHRFTLGKRQEIIWGFGVRLMDHEVDNLELFRFEPNERNLRLYSLFFQDRISILDERLDITLGIKAEHNSYTGMQYQPSVRFGLQLPGSQILWAAVSRAVRIPARIDRDFYLNLTREIPLITGNNDFRSESLLGYELGWRLSSAANASLSVSTFYNSYDNLRTVEPGPAPLFVPLTFGNGVEGYTYGLEFSGTFQPWDRLRFSGGYTFLKKELKVKPSSGDLNEGSVESNDPEHQFLVQTMIDPVDDVELSFTTRYVDALPNPRVAAYWEMDVRVGWHPAEFIEISVVAQNLLHDKHLEFIPSSPPPRSLQRGVYGKVVCRF
jgi:iron complex outermembrane receptor protein